MQTESKVATRIETQRLTEEFLAKGGEIIDGNAVAAAKYSGQDWARLAQGLKVATEAEIVEERKRRALIAIGNNDLELVTKLLQHKFDKEIKFDIENDRLGPNGEIR